MSYRQILYHIVFGTKHRKPTIPDEHCTELYRYIWGVVKNQNCRLYRVNGVADHIHILSDLHPSVSLADFVKAIKVGSSLWMKANGNFPAFEGWAVGYGAFTYSIKERDRIINYIKKQKEHHRKITYETEYKSLLDEHGVTYDERHLFT
ncbi:IS200/IS605 family transposase [Rudanella paleaurantiibacter]|uniref:IS200/IS605 family transposase n=1 Tax=Rudanella paleaurantiibacter TaxID=2614655 RepID=A0A7J5TZM0_9BACT|nr:IS200/IS605 family transposase [Rudanella paleaurantiibacter]KAB7730933.1 IS200/IS605 family transposase [Rudanella paleaurantiibacter]